LTTGAAAQRRYRAKNLVKVRLRDTQYQTQLKLARPEWWLWQKAKVRAKRNGLEFRLTVADVVLPEVCPVFGLALIPARGKAKDNSPTLDRLDSAVGYVPGNVRVISWRANRLKNNATAEDLRRIVDWIESERGVGK